MNRFFKTGLAALMFGGGLAVLPAAAQSFGLGFGPQGGVEFSYDSGGYCDQWGCPDDFWDMPVYYGPIYWAGEWYDGPVYYRDWYGQRQYWIHGGWRYDDWRGPRPSWYREGRFGPALGMNFYRDNGFHGRWDNDRRDNGRGFDGRGFNQGFNGRGFQQQPQQRGFRDNQAPAFGGGRGFRNNAPQQQAPAFDGGRGFRDNAPRQQAPADNGGRGFGGRPQNNAGQAWHGRGGDNQPHNNPPAGDNRGGRDHHRGR